MSSITTRAFRDKTNRRPADNTIAETRGDRIFLVGI
jgi:hypothetical protein